MNALAIIIDVQTMSSREIADLTGSTHDNVLKTVRALAAKGVVSGNETPYTHPQNGQTYREFLLSFRDTMVVVSGYSAELRAKIIDRWQQLEAGAAPAVPQTYAQALRLAAEQAEEIERQQRQLALAAPKVEFAEAMLNTDGTTLVRDVAKTIGVPVRPLEKALREKHIILSNNAPAAKYVTKGYFKESTQVYETNTRGTQMSHTARVTGLGIEFLRRFAARHLASPEPPLRQQQANLGEAMFAPTNTASMKTPATSTKQGHSHDE